MIKKYRKFLERRHKSTLKPLLYLFLEMIILGLMCWIVFQLDILPLNILIVAASLYFFVVYSLKRYTKVQERQHFYKE